MRPWRRPFCGALRFELLRHGKMVPLGMGTQRSQVCPHLDYSVNPALLNEPGYPKCEMLRFGIEHETLVRLAGKMVCVARDPPHSLPIWARDAARSEAKAGVVNHVFAKHAPSVELVCRRGLVWARTRMKRRSLFNQVVKTRSELCYAPGSASAASWNIVLSAMLAWIARHGLSDARCRTLRRFNKEAQLDPLNGCARKCCGSSAVLVGGALGVGLAMMPHTGTTMCCAPLLPPPPPRPLPGCVCNTWQCLQWCSSHWSRGLGTRLRTLSETFIYLHVEETHGQRGRCQDGRAAKSLFTSQKCSILSSRGSLPVRVALAEVLSQHKRHEMLISRLVSRRVSSNYGTCEEECNGTPHLDKQGTVCPSSLSRVGRSGRIGATEASVDRLA